MNIKELIPKDKFDTETAEKLKQYSYEDIKPIIPELLEWLQDYNWPASRPVAEFLQSIAPNISNEIIEILRGDDALWKYWCIGIFGFDTQDILLKKEIERIAFNPTDYEIEEFIQESALKAFDYWKTKD